MPVVKKAAKKTVALPEEMTFEATLEKATPGTYKFQEVADPDDFICRTVYVQKSAYGDGVKPKRIRVTVETLEVDAE